MSAKKCRHDTMILLFTTAIASAFAECRSELERLRKQLNWLAHLEVCHRNPDILERVLNQIALSNSTAGKCAPIQVVKQPEHRKTSTTEEQK